MSRLGPSSTAARGRASARGRCRGGRPTGVVRSPRVPPERPVMLAKQCLELAAMLTARVAVRAVDAAAVPRQPPPGAASTYSPWRRSSNWCSSEDWV